MKRTCVLAVSIGVAVTLLVVSFVRGPASAQDKPAPAGPKWQYKVVTKAAGVLPAEEAELNRLGDEGWELAAVAARIKDGQPAASFVFKRPKR
jgi:hypothetical protein